MISKVPGYTATQPRGESSPEVIDRSCHALARDKRRRQGEGEDDKRQDGDDDQ